MDWLYEEVINLSKKVVYYQKYQSFFIFYFSKFFYLLLLVLLESYGFKNSFEKGMKKVPGVSRLNLPSVGFVANTLMNNIAFILEVQYWHLL
jgi:hypothetical protein